MLGPGTEAPKAEKPKVVQSAPGMVCRNGVCTPAKSVKRGGFFKNLLRK